MNSNSQGKRRALQTLAVAASVAALAAPAALAAGGIVPAKLGSPDPREAQAKVLSPGLVRSKLGSHDPRDTAGASGVQLAGRRLAIREPHDASYDGDFMFRDYFRGTHYVARQR